MDDEFRFRYPKPRPSQVPEPVWDTWTDVNDPFIIAGAYEVGVKTRSGVGNFAQPNDVYNLIYTRTSTRVIMIKVHGKIEGGDYTPTSERSFLEQMANPANRGYIWFGRAVLREDALEVLQYYDHPDKSPEIREGYLADLSRLIDFEITETMTVQTFPVTEYYHDI